MKYKIIFLVTALFFLTGCSAVYKIEIKDSKVKEDITISMNNDEKSNISYFKNNKFYAVMDGASKFIPYEKNVSSDESKTKAEFNHTYSIQNYRKSTALKSCFTAFNVAREGSYYIISTSEGITCATEENNVVLENLTIKIKTNHVVESDNSNAKSNNKNEYVWKFDKKNYSKAKIYMKLERNKYVSNYDDESKRPYIVIITIIFIIIAFIIIALTKIVKDKEEKA